jgi:hypothetical protein
MVVFDYPFLSHLPAMDEHNNFSKPNHVERKYEQAVSKQSFVGK